jgi:NAD+ diphosphatase
MTKRPRPIFAKNALDRMDPLRSSVHARLLVKTDPTDRFVLLSEKGVVVRRSDERVTFSAQDVEDIPHDKTQAVFLGKQEGELFFVLPASPDDDERYEHVDLWTITTQDHVSEAGLGMLAQACGVMQWHRTHAYCGACGGKTSPAHGGWRRDCGSCGRQHFPRLDPVVIMLVTHGDSCLLGAGRNFRTRGLYSCLAGFMEPGETIEDAARRELQEEAGVSAGRVEYLCSQPWPFPYSLMIGLHLEAEDTRTTRNEQELSDLKWASKKDVEAVLKGAEDRGFLLPRPVAIASKMLEAWVSTEGSDR